MSRSLLRLYLSDTKPKYFFDDPTLDAMLEKADDDINAAAAEGWRVKAGHVSEWYDATLDGSSLSRSDVFDHCMKLAEMYGDASSAGITNFGITVTPEATEEVSEFG